MALGKSKLVKGLVPGINLIKVRLLVGSVNSKNILKGFFEVLLLIKKAVVNIKFPLSLKFPCSLSSQVLVLLELVGQLTGVQALDLAGDFRELGDVEGLRVLP